ncbi:MAG: hypothetical protein MJ051_07175 [Akkermansia sp.]|nr:hypothetical protein [Akkermansia sp.]
MKRWLLLIIGVQAFTSCAYVQTHKNVEEAFCRYEGASIAKQPELYRAGDRYLIAAERCELSKHYPVIHDTVFFDENNEPKFHVEQNSGEKVYYPVSAGTALVLQRSDGYAALPILRDELQRQVPLQHLPSGARLCDVRAEIAETDLTNAGLTAGPRDPQSLPLWLRALSQTEEVIIDWPATLGYNCAIPIMAPFVFFHRFLSEE